MPSYWHDSQGRSAMSSARKALARKADFEQTAPQPGCTGTSCRGFASFGAGDITGLASSPIAVWRDHIVSS